MTLIQQALARIEEMEKRAEGASPDVRVADGSYADFSEDGATLLCHANDEEAKRVLARFNHFYESRFSDAEFYASARTDLPDLCSVAKPLLAFFAVPGMNIPKHLQDDVIAALKAFVEAK